MKIGVTLQGNKNYNTKIAKILLQDIRGFCLLKMVYSYN